MNFFKDFKKFILRGNVLDLAIAVVIGAAFGKIITSFVNHVLMPPIGLALGGVEFADLKFVLKDGVSQLDSSGVMETIGEVSIMYGKFIQSIVDFLIIGLVIFLIIRSYNKTRTKEEEPAPPPTPSAEESLLTEIRDILKQK